MNKYLEVRTILFAGNMVQKRITSAVFSVLSEYEFECVSKINDESEIRRIDIVNKVSRWYKIIKTQELTPNQIRYSLQKIFVASCVILYLCG